MVDQDLPISGLPAASALSGVELSPVVQNGVTSFIPTSAYTYLPTNNYGLYSQTGSSAPVSGSASAVATSGSLLDGGVGTLTVPANSFKKGDTFHARMSGKITIANNNTLEIRFKAGNADLVDTNTVAMASSTNKNWSLDTTFVVREVGTAGNAVILSSGELQIRKDAGGEVITEVFSSINSTTFDTTIDNTLIVEGILGAACIASENIYSELFILHKIY